MSVSQVISSSLIVFVAYRAGHDAVPAPITTTVVQPVEYLPADHFFAWNDEHDFYRGRTAVPLEPDGEAE